MLMSMDSGPAEECGACSTKADTLVLLADAVMCLGATSGWERPSFAGRVVVSEADLRARGLPAAAANGLELVDDEAVVALIEAHRHCLSWA